MIALAFRRRARQAPGRAAQPPGVRGHVVPSGEVLVHEALEAVKAPEGSRPLGPAPPSGSGGCRVVPGARRAGTAEERARPRAAPEKAGTRWNSTQVYRRVSDQWRVVHVNWSFTRHPAAMQGLME